MIVKLLFVVMVTGDGQTPEVLITGNKYGNSYVQIPRGSPASLDSQLHHTDHIYSSDHFPSTIFLQP